jgi:two-component system sensor histidine kinase BarA
MQLTSYRREYIKEIVSSKFVTIPQRVLETLMDEFNDFLEKDKRDFLYNIHYLLYRKKDIQLTQIVLHAIVKTFIFLYEDVSDKKDRETIKRQFDLLFDTLFIQRCFYARKVEERAKIAQKILLHTTERLSKTIETQELMIANISHEMRTSLNAIYGYLHIIEERNTLSGEEYQFLQKANHSTLALKSLVSDILNVTKLNSGQLEIQNEYFWIDDMLMQCIDNIALELKKKKKVTLVKKIPFFPYQVYGDKAHIMEILINLLSNAVKYTERGTIRLEVHYKQLKQGYHIIFSVIDSGIGMTADQVKTAFVPYNRFKTEKQGLGLGLHIARELAKKLNGTLKVESTYGKGSHFEFQMTFHQTRQFPINIAGKHFCFFIDQSKYIDTKSRLEFLAEKGANIHVFHQETEFINFLLTENDNIPEMIFVVAGAEGYTKFDALIYYLRTLPSYKKTIFIAENVSHHVSLKFFDEKYEHAAPISVYNKLLKTVKNKYKNKSKNISLLVIDDTETNLDIFKLFVSQRFPNITIDLAGGGYEGIGMFKIKEYDLVFLDLKMPGLNGFDVLKKLEKLGSLPPIYAFSADIYRSNFEKIEEYGFTGLVEKPLQPEKLFEIIQKAIDEKSDT